jgi:hypothetical protein
MHAWHLTYTSIAMNGPALHAFDVHGSSVQNCVLTGGVTWTDEYSRPVWMAGEMVFDHNTIIGGMTFASRLAVVGAYVSDYNQFSGSVVSWMGSDTHSTVIGADTTPPAAITDLRSTSGSTTVGTQYALIALMFTAPADSNAGGKFAVSRYEATIGLPGRTQSVTRMYVVADTSSPAPVPRTPGSTERFFVKVPADGAGRLVQVYSYDFVGNRSLGSNTKAVIAVPWAPVAVAVGGAAALIALAASALIRRRNSDPGDTSGGTA